MVQRELVVLGTASQAPTRTRNHNGYLLRWDGWGVLVDPGEGTQRQLLLADVPSSAITHICVTHAHGDHLLGLPGVLMRMALDRVAHPVHLCYPAHAEPYVRRLRAAAVYDDRVDVREHALDGAADVPSDAATGLRGRVSGSPPFTLRAEVLDHRIPTLGWRVQEPDGRRMLPDRLEAAGVRGPAIGALQAAGSLEVGGRVVRLEDVSAPRPGQSAAVVMDTRPCPGAATLAAGADLLVAEATFLDRDAELAQHYGHLTAGQAGALAAAAGARRLVLTHFSQRYPDTVEHLAEASLHHADVHAASDLDVIPVPPRRT